MGLEHARRNRPHGLAPLRARRRGPRWPGVALDPSGLLGLGGLLGLAVLLCLAPPARGQEEDLTAPPRIEAEPGRARLAEQPPERREALEEVIVVGGGEWRLPDLGSSWRQAREREPDTGRIDADFLPLYDPENPAARSDPFATNREMQRVGFIELFRIRFGRRSAD